MERIKPEAILFDLDGVLVDSLDAWFRALNRALRRFGYKEISKEEFISKYWGHDLFDNLRTMNIPIEVGAFCNKMYSEHIENVKLCQDVTDVLKKLDGYKKGVITNTPRDSTTKILKRFDLTKFFNIVLTSDDVRKSKPDPEIIVKSCRLLNVNPRNVVLIGDTESDVIAGRGAGCKIIGINVDADIKVRKLSDIIDFILV